MQRVRFNAQADAEFSRVLKSRVEAWFIDNKIAKDANALLVFKSLSFFVLAVSNYVLIMSGTWSHIQLLLLAAVQGFLMAEVGLSTGHDAIHGAYFRNRRWNKLAMFSFDIIGACSYTWGFAHNVVHHTWTQITTHDRDISPPDVFRLFRRPNHSWFHKYQYIYGPFLLPLISLSWAMKKDFMEMFDVRLKDQTEAITSRRPKATAGAYIQLFAFKAFHYFMFIGMPMMVLNLTFAQALLGFFVFHYFLGLTLIMFFILGHAVEGCELIYPTQADPFIINHSFEAHQVRTTCTFGRGKFLSTWFSGGLNYHIEHHLFPTIAHIHYPAISGIVKATAEEYGITYTEFPTFWTAYRSHLRKLKYLGAAPITPADPVGLAEAQQA